MEDLVEAETQRRVFLEVSMEEAHARDLAEALSEALVCRLPAMALEDPAETLLLYLAASCPMAWEAARVALVRPLAPLGLQ